jgi:23S rRNA pseudouridine1911/1915/1917 synthase
MPFFHPRWPIFYEDNHLLVLYKPAGLIMQRDIKGKISLLDLARHYLKQRYAKPGRVFVGMVHRLDGPVAGVLVLARTSKAAARLSAQIREHRVVKTYLAVVEHHAPPLPSVGRLEHGLVRDGRLSRAVTDDIPGSRKAALNYRTLEQGNEKSLLEIDLETGRRHQIRAQLSARQSPILGDRAYGADGRLADGRIALLAYRLTFEHPTRRQTITIESPPPLGWPWESSHPNADRPLWTIEDYLRDGLKIEGQLPSFH